VPAPTAVLMPASTMVPIWAHAPHCMVHAHIHDEVVQASLTAPFLMPTPTLTTLAASLMPTHTTPHCPSQTSPTAS
jgi:hypothetical protein